MSILKSIKGSLQISSNILVAGTAAAAGKQAAIVISQLHFHISSFSRNLSHFLSLLLSFPLRILLIPVTSFITHPEFRNSNFSSRWIIFHISIFPDTPGPNGFAKNTRASILYDYCDFANNCVFRFNIQIKSICQMKYCLSCHIRKKIPEKIWNN